MKTKLHSLKIKDELHGRLSMSTKYLACSVINEDLESVPKKKEDLDSKGSCTPDGEDHPKLFSVEEDSFMDALTDFTPDQSSNIHDLDTASDIEHTLSFDGDQQKVKHNEIFYEAQDNNVTDFVVLTFLSRTPDSFLYDGIDSQVTELYFPVFTKRHLSACMCLLFPKCCKQGQSKKVLIIYQIFKLEFSE